MAITSNAHEWRFSLRTLFIAILIVAIAAARWKWFWYLGVMGQVRIVFWPALLLFAAIAWNAGQSGPRAFVPKSIVAKVIAIVWLGLFSLIALYLLWACYRWRYLASFAKVQPIPYPDEMLLALHNWLDRRYPAEPGSIKIHGEVDFVYVIVNYSGWFATAILAFQFGLLFRVDRWALLERVTAAMTNLICALRSRKAK